MYAFAFLMFCPKLSLLSYSNCLLFLRFGRKLILRCCLLQLAISGTCAAFAPTFLIYCSLRFWSGCSAVVIVANNIMLSKSIILVSSHFPSLKNHFEISSLCDINIPFGFSSSYRVDKIPVKSHDINTGNLYL